MPLRSDLTIESADLLLQSSPLPSGVSLKRYLRGSFHISDCVISTPAAAKKIGKPKGRYVTFESKSPLESSQNIYRDCLALSEEIKSLLGSRENILVVGLGNSSVTPDSLGPAVADRVLATRHLNGELAKLFDCRVSVLTPGVMGKTGLESQEVIKSAVRVTGSEAVIVIDALACGGVSKMGHAIQLSNTGICPGSGVMNSRREISRNTVGAECIAIGVPTMADSKDLGLMVTPKSIDRIINHTSRLIAGGINLSLHPNLSLSELELLCE